MKINSIHFFSALFLLIACDDDTPYGTSGDNSNQNANPTVIQNARNLEMPRLDDQTGDIYSHYVTYRGEQVLNYTLDWHKEKKHSRWVAFVFTNTTSGTSWNRNNWKGTEWNGKVWEGDPFQPDPDIPAGERNELSDFSRSGYQCVGRPPLLHGCQRTNVLPLQHESANGQFQLPQLVGPRNASTQLGTQQQFPRHTFCRKRRNDT